MKKITICFIVLFYTLKGYGQSPRLQLIEEFGNESLFESASDELTFDSFLLQNTASTIALKYKISYNSSSLFQGHIANKSGAGNRRENYYNINNIKGPYGLQDGKAFLQPSNIDTGKLYNLSQTAINNRSTSLSPFTVSINHAFNNTFDSVNVTVIVQCTQNYIAHDSTVGEIKLRLCLAEKEIHLKNPTGDNGIKDYFNIAWDYFPVYWNHGITLGRIWNVGQTDTLHYKICLNVSPSSYVYDYSQLCFVGFIQDDGYGGNKNSFSVLQAGYSAPIPIPVNIPDAGIENNFLFPTGYCVDSITPSYKITNHALPTITSLQILYTTNYWSSWTTYNWSGILQKDSAVIITFPKTILVPGYDTLVGRINIENGYLVGNSQWSFANKHDFNSANNITNQQDKIYNHVVDTDYVYHSIHHTFETFAQNAWDQACVFVEKSYYQPFYTIEYDINWWPSQNPLGGYATSNRSKAWEFKDYPKYNFKKQMASLVSKHINLTGKINVGLSFDYAFAKQNTFNNDTLNVQYSIDCGVHWQSIWLKSGNMLATAPNDSLNYFFPDCTQWKTANISLHNLDNVTDVMLKFEGVADGGNMLYLDNINFDSNEGAVVNEIVNVSGKLYVYPNPTSDFIKIDLQDESNLKTIEIYNVVGSLIFSQNVNSNSISLNISSFASGLYFIRTVDNDGKMYQSKLVKQ
jgi:Secretion system C-terminal sorting domain